MGSERFVEQAKLKLKSSAYHLKCKPDDDRYFLKEPAVIYNVHLPPEKGRLRLENSYFWQDNTLNTIRCLGPNGESIGPITAVVLVGIGVSMALTFIDEHYGITDRVIKQGKRMKF